MKGGEGKQRARAYGGEDKLLKLDEDQVQASPNYKAKIKTQSTSTTKERVRAYEGEDKLLKLGEDQVQASPNYKAKIKMQATLTLHLRYDILSRASRFKKVVADKRKKSSMETFAPHDKADYYARITSITVNRKNAYELKGKFLDDLHNNDFSGTNGKDAFEHIEYYLKIIDPIKLPNVDHDKLRVVVFPISLAGGARRWFDRTKESITCWVDLTAKIFGKYYPPSRIEGDNTPSDKEEIAEIFKIETDVFDYETPLCLAFNEFSYLLKVDQDLLTNDIMGFKTYEDYKDDWIYKWNENVPWVYDKPWLDNGIWKEPKPVEHTCKPFNYKTGCLEWPTYSWREDGYYNGGNLLDAYHIENSLHYQDFEWYETLEDSELKNEALRNKAIMKGLISDDESGNDC
ncbi:hypothetical protein Tco_0345104 [Tanacetum coccineum]